MYPLPGCECFHCFDLQLMSAPRPATLEHLESPIVCTTALGIPSVNTGDGTSS